MNMMSSPLISSFLQSLTSPSEVRYFGKEDLNKIKASTGFEPMTLCDTSAALLPTELSSQLGAGHLSIRNIPVEMEKIS